VFRLRRLLGLRRLFGVLRRQSLRGRVRCPALGGGGVRGLRRMWWMRCLRRL
jgi:hypothetical protein